MMVCMTHVITVFSTALLLSIPLLMVLVVYEMLPPHPVLQPKAYHWEKNHLLAQGGYEVL